MSPKFQGLKDRLGLNSLTFQNKFRMRAAQMLAQRSVLTE